MVGGKKGGGGWGEVSDVLYKIVARDINKNNWIVSKIAELVMT